MSRTKGNYQDVTLPNRFRPLFWEEQSGRTLVVRTIKQRLAALKEDCGADSVQKDILCQQAVFIALQLETAQIRAVEDGVFDPGVFTSMVNSLLGILKTLGLEKSGPKTIGLQDYLKQHEARA
jgi:hypothetical protein